LDAIKDALATVASNRERAIIEFPFRMSGEC
jgi:hypothetical protein